LVEPDAAPRARVFYALWPDAGLARAMGAHGTRLGAVLGGRLVRPGTLHLTLAFLGEVGCASLAQLAAPPSAVSAPCFDLRLDRCGVWPHNGIAWLAPASMPPALALLQQRLWSWLESLGFASDPRAFRPHVSLLRRVRAPLAEGAIEPLAWSVRHWCLVRSRLSPQGADYEPLARFALQGEDR
jgi:2'-5' RNA ligase